MLEERKIDTLAVLGLNGDPALRAIDVEPRYLSEDRVGGGGQSAVDHIVVPDGRGQLRLESHRVEQAVVSQVDLTDVHAVVECRDEERQAEQAAQRCSRRDGSPRALPLRLRTLHDVGHQLVQRLLPCPGLPGRDRSRPRAAINLRERNYRLLYYF